MLDPSPYLHPDELAYRTEQAELRNKLDPMIDIGTEEEPCKMRYSEWRTHVEIGLHPYESDLEDLLHDRSLRCGDPAHGTDPFCKLQKRFFALKKTLSPFKTTQQNKTLRPLLGDELPAESTKPWTAEERAVYDRIKEALDRYEHEHAKIKVQMSVDAEVPGTIAQSQPVAVQENVAVSRTEQERLAADLTASLQQEGISAPRAENQRTAPARTREEISASEKQGTIREYLHRSIEHAARIYEASGMPTWAVAARQLETQMNRFSPAQLTWMEDRRQMGEIIFPMPSADVQRTTMHDAAYKLKPQFTKNNQQQTANDPSFYDYFENLMKSGDATLVAGIPNQSYFVVLPPSVRPTEGSANKTLSQQLAWLDQQKRSRAHNDVTIDASLPAEFIALQTIWTAKGGEPIDASTWTRFITIPKSPGGYVLGAYWGGDRLRFDWLDDDENAIVGVRLLGRVAPQN